MAYPSETYSPRPRAGSPVCATRNTLASSGSCAESSARIRCAIGPSADRSSPSKRPSVLDSPDSDAWCEGVGGLTAFICTASASRHIDANCEMGCESRRTERRDRTPVGLARRKADHVAEVGGARVCTHETRTRTRVLRRGGASSGQARVLIFFNVISAIFGFFETSSQQRRAG